jgi:hypothetical protein
MSKRESTEPPAGNADLAGYVSAAHKGEKPPPDTPVPHIRAEGYPEAISRIRIRKAAPAPANDNPNSRIRIEKSLSGIHRHCADGQLGGRKGLVCESVLSPAQFNSCRMVTNIPGQIPVLTGEVALIETYWGAILDIMTANDNEPN